MASGSGHLTDGRRRKYKSPATRAAEEAADLLELPILPEYLRGDDGPSGNEEENDAKRPRSTSTTPKSARGTDAEYDRCMGVSSVNPSEGDRFGDGDVTDAEGIEEGVANNSTVSTPLIAGSARSSNCPDANLDSRFAGVIASWNALIGILAEYLALPPHVAGKAIRLIEQLIGVRKLLILSFP